MLDPVLDVILYFGFKETYEVIEYKPDDRGSIIGK
jgi:hypothetical protein